MNWSDHGLKTKWRFKLRIRMKSINAASLVVVEVEHVFVFKVVFIMHRNGLKVKNANVINMNNILL